MLSKMLFLVVVLLTSIINCFSQKVIIDKTTDTYRKIITDEVDWYGLGQDNKATLCYYTYKDSVSYYIIDIDWNVERKEAEAGYKLLLKQKSGDIMEVDCVLGRKNLKEKVNPFFMLMSGGNKLPSVEIHVNACYYLTESQVISLIKNPVVKMRVEFTNEYYDIDCLKKNGTSPFSEYLNRAYLAIKTARDTKKTGLYDNF